MKEPEKMTSKMMLLFGIHISTSIERSKKIRGNTGNVQELCFSTFLETV